MMSKLVAAAALAAPLLVGSAAAGPAESKAFADLVSEYEAFQRSEDPITAGQEGDIAALPRLPDVSLEADKRRAAKLKEFEDRLSQIPANALGGEEAFNREFLDYVLKDAVVDYTFDTARMPFVNDSGFHTTPDYLARITRLRAPADIDAWMARLSGLPKYLDDNLANLKRGVETGFTQPQIVVDRVIEVLARQMAVPVADDVLLLPFKTADKALDAASLEKMRAQAAVIVAQQIRPRQQAVLDYLKSGYTPRSGLAVKDVPGGAEYYRAMVRRHTTTDLEPEAIFELGEKEVARIRREMDAVIKEAGFKGSFAEFQAFLRSDAQFYATSREQLLEKASEIAKRSDDRLPELFATLPRLPYGVRPVPADQEESYTTGRYFPGSPELGIAGGYLVNTSHLDQRPLYELPALTLHEAVPGHHIQIALQQELKELPYFRRNASITAYTEGWGLYAEYLGEEMGIYRTPYEKFGRLSYEMWRACRLVADTGIHWKGWTIEQARACFTDNSALAPHNIQTELERYISWPGQALGYKIGEMKLKALRAEAEARLGAQFDVRKFHDLVLLSGPMPLDMLSRRVDSWLGDEQAKGP